MTILHRDGLVLIPQSEVFNLSSPAVSPAAAKACQITAKWANSFLTQPHPDLGRDGPVCPFTLPSLEKELFWLAPYDHDLDDEQLARDIVLSYLDWFQTLEPHEGTNSVLKTILIIFHRLSASEADGILGPLQKHLKPEFVKRGLMVGQFYEGCTERGLWNDNFFPLQSPIPLLAIRWMVPSDFPFLHGNRGTPEMLIAYFQRFGHQLPTPVRDLIVTALDEYEKRSNERI